jgi:hypothetical protein
MSHMSVREALETSVAWTRPPVSFQSSQLSMVPKASWPAFASVLASGTLLQEPRGFGAGKVGVQNQSRAIAEFCGMGSPLQAAAVCGRATVLPDDRVVYRTSCATIPHDGRFSLICDADRSDVGGGHFCFPQCGAGDGQLGCPDFFGVVFHPARLGEVLSEFFLRDCKRRTIRVEDDRAGTCGPLIQRQNDLAHTALLRMIQWRPASADRLVAEI